MNARTALNNYIAREGRPAYAVARELGISQGYMSRLLSGQRAPSLKVAARIEQQIGIPAAAWVARTASARVA